MSKEILSSTRVFVGNISYDSTEQQLIDLFSEIGEVVNFTIVTDRDTGKQKGFGFCDFTDAETAKSAIRNLDKHDFHGRSLRVAYADDNMDSKDNAQGSKQLTAADHVELISKTVNLMSHQQKVEILAQMKSFIVSHPDAAKKLLTQNPQLAHILLHIQLLFGMVKPNDISSLQQQPVAPPSAQYPAASHPQASYSAPPAPYGAPPVPYNPPPMPYSAPPGPSHGSHGHRYMPPPAAYQYPPAYEERPRPAPVVLSPEHQALLRQVMSLTPEQFSLLPADVQYQVRQLQAMTKGM